MYWLKIILLAVVIIGFGFYSFQKGREYERGMYRVNKDKKNNQTDKPKK